VTIATSKNLTILGVLTILGALVNAAIDYLNTKTINFPVTLAAISTGIGFILGKGAASTGGTVDAAGKPVIPPIAVLLLAAGLGLAPGLARADSPAYGGCWTGKSGTQFCASPTVSVTALRISLKDGSVIGTAEPALGYGLTIAADKWYSAQISMNGALRATSTGSALSLGPQLLFAKYITVGLDYQLGGSAKFRDSASIIFGLGTAFGSPPSK